MTEKVTFSMIKELAEQGNLDEAYASLTDYIKGWKEFTLQEKEEILIFQIDISIKILRLSHFYTDADYYKNIKDIISVPILSFKENVISAGENKAERTKQLQKYLEAVELMAQQKYYSDLDAIINTIGCDTTTDAARAYTNYFQGYLKLHSDIISAFFLLTGTTQASYTATNHYKEAMCATSKKLFARAIALTEQIHGEASDFPYFFDSDIAYMYLLAIYLVEQSLSTSDIDKIIHLKHKVALMCDFLNAILVKEGRRVSLLQNEGARTTQYNDILTCEKEIQKVEADYCHPPVDKQAVSLQSNQNSSGGCYVATAVYGSYDCPEVWTLRRYRDEALASTWYGRMFIRTYYAISPTLVKWFGKTAWFKKTWQGKLDRMVADLQKNGVESTPYEDKEWK